MQNVTVLMPAYNHGNVLSFQIESLLKQTSPPKNIIILDDGSTDETQEILSRYQQNETVKVISQKKNMGLHAAINLLLNQVGTGFFAFAAADDILTRDWCMTTASLLETYRDAKMAITNSFIFENNRTYLTDSINTLNNKCEGVYKPSQYIELLMRHGKLPPSNTILYRSDIIEELIRPIFLKKELRSLVDVLLILAIATRYPIAYSTKPTGIFVKSNKSYGESFFSKEYLKDIVHNIELFSVRDRYIQHTNVVRFVISNTKYTWTKQIILRDMASNKMENKGSKYFFNSFFYYFKLLAIFLVYKRFRFLKFSRFKNNSQKHELEKFIDTSLFKRFDSV